MDAITSNHKRQGRKDLYKVTFSMLAFVLTTVSKQNLLTRGDVQRHGIERIHGARTRTVHGNAPCGQQHFQPSSLLLCAPYDELLHDFLTRIV
jgi:hypothetical protein